MSDLVQTASTEIVRIAAPAAPEPARRDKRIMSGLQALFTFQEGKGNLVRHESGGEPLLLTIADPSAVRWSGDGIIVESSTLIASDRSPKRLTQSIKKTNAVTLEVWVTPADTQQSGPARILTLSSGTGQRNFTLAQDGDKYDVRLRGTKTDGNGLPSLASSGGSLATRRTHVVYTRDASGKTRLYIDGQQVAASDVGGDLSNWDENFRLALANETTRDRTWRGTLHLTAIYDRALSAEEVRQNYAAGN
jgi:hypothetical protein